MRSNQRGAACGPCRVGGARCGDGEQPGCAEGSGGVKFARAGSPDEASRRESLHLDGKLGDDDVKGKEDKALLNLITQTAKKSSYNNSRRHGLGTVDVDPPPKEQQAAKPAVEPRRASPRDGPEKEKPGFTTEKGKGASSSASASPSSSPASSRRRKKSPFVCCGTIDEVDGSATSVQGGKNGKDRDRLVLRDPTSKVSYNIEHLIGEGGFSKVLLVRAKSGHLDVAAAAQNPQAQHVPSRRMSGIDADETENGKVYAAKIIPKSHLKSAGESFIKATMLERNILGKFHHPFLLKLYHAFQERDRLILVIDYCPGGSLHTHVNISLREKGGGFDEARAAFYVAEMALAIAHLHKHGIVHRDLKLENVLMYRNGHCAVSDFGASKRIKPMDPDLCCAGKSRGHSPSAPDKAAAAQEGAAAQDAARDPAPVATHTKSIVGTPAYMAPEMLLTQPYDYSVDWWALGVVLFTMLKGRLPFDAPEEEKMLWRIVKSKPRYDPSWSQPLLDVLRALLQKRPTTRLSSLKALSRHDLYRDTDWTKLEACGVDPPYVPSFDTDNDTKYLPKRIAETALPTMSLDYKKGDSMKKLFRKFSHRGSFDATANPDTNVQNTSPRI